MRWVAGLNSIEDLVSIQSSESPIFPSEILLGHEGLSRLGTFTDGALEKAAKEARKLDVRPILEWDILMTEAELNKSAEIISSWSDEMRAQFGAVRVQDPGALQYLLEHWKGLPIQLNLETGNHNWDAIEGWIASGEGRIERIILSIELPIDRLRTYSQKLKESAPGVSIELLGLGPILLLYTPRHLLSTRASFTPSDTIRSIASSDEGVHKGFRVLENRHGTFLFHQKDYCLMEHAEDLSQAGVQELRLDFRLEQDSAPVITALSDMSRYPNKTTRCFYQANATDVLFKKLKNTRVQRMDHHYVGEVVESSKGSHTIIQVLGKDQTITLGQTFKFISPDGHIKEQIIDSLTNLDGEVVNEVAMGDYAVTPYIKLATARTAVYRD